MNGLCDFKNRHFFLPCRFLAIFTEAISMMRTREISGEHENTFLCARALGTFGKFFPVLIGRILVVQKQEAPPVL
jgi:hypothetical protein